MSVQRRRGGTSARTIKSSRYTTQRLAALENEHILWQAGDRASRQNLGISQIHHLIVQIIAVIVDARDARPPAAP